MKKLTPREKKTLYRRGNHFYTSNNLEKSRECFEKVLKSDPSDQIALHDLALVDMAEQKFDRAEDNLKKVLIINPSFTLAKVTLANVFWNRGDHEIAISHLEESLKSHCSPRERVLLQESLIQKYLASGIPEKALEHLKELPPEYANNTKHLNEIAFCHLSLDNLDQAVQFFQKSLSLQPDQPDAHRWLSRAYFRKKDFISSRKHLELFHSLSPEDYAIFHFNMVENFLRELKFTEALLQIQALLEKKPNDSEAINELMRVNSFIFRFRENREIMKNLVSFMKENPEKIEQNTLFAFSISETITPEDLFLIHRSYAKRKIPQNRLQLLPDKNEKRPLRVGFISGDFYHHPVSQFFLPLLNAFRKLDLQTYGYSNTTCPDRTTDVYKETFSFWKNLVGIPDEKSANVIREANLDILVDLSGHTADNRIRIIGYHPARVTCTYLGYLTTTGLDAMDYWILDETVFPEFMEEQLAETPYRLKRPWISYPLPANRPEIHQIRKSLMDPILFGTANNVNKYSEQAIRLFAKVLHAVPNSRILLKHNYFSQKECTEGAINSFSMYGIPANRLIFKGFDPYFEDHIRNLQQIDIALDTTPFNGGTTTCDTLYAGVPVLTLAGRRFISRMSATILHSLGLDEWICATEEEFVAKACTFALDIEGRNQFRATIQQRMADSKLCDVDDLAKCMIEAFHDMLAKAGY